MYYVTLVSLAGTFLDIHEDELPENWILLLPIIEEEKTRHPGQGYEGGPARNFRLKHECWRFFSPTGNLHSLGSIA